MTPDEAVRDTVRKCASVDVTDDTDLDSVGIDEYQRGFIYSLLQADRVLNFMTVSMMEFMQCKTMGEMVALVGDAELPTWHPQGGYL